MTPQTKALVERRSEIINGLLGLGLFCKAEGHPKGHRLCADANKLIEALERSLASKDEALRDVLDKADAVRALAEEQAPKMPSKTLWGDDVRAFDAAVAKARASLNDTDEQEKG